MELKPAQIHPHQHIGYSLSIVHLRNEELAKLEGIVFEKDAMNDITLIDHLRSQITQLRKEGISAEKSRDFWSTLASVARYVSSIASIALGIGCLTLTGPGAIAGHLLIAAGSLSLFNNIAADTGSWHYLTSFFVETQNRQKKIANTIESSLTWLSLGITVLSGIGAAHAGILQQSTRIEQIAKTLATMGVIAHKSAETSKAYYDSLVKTSESHCIRKEAVIFTRQMNLQTQTFSLGKTLGMQTQIGQVVQSSIQV